MSHERKTSGTHELSSTDLSKSEQKQAEGDHPAEARQDGRVRPGKAAAAAGAAAAIKGKTTKSSGKDRHSKVNTARGPRDRRVRLSVSTAIQFYDIQDRLGFDQPSKAIEWLLKKAKPAIDELNQLPPAPLSIGQGAGKKPLLKADESVSTSNQVQPALLQGTSDERSLHEMNELELVRCGSRVKVSRERDRVHKESGREMTELPHHGHQEVSYTTPSMPANVYESGGGSPSPVCSSFTQLLQSPFPSSLQNFIHSSSSQTLLQNQLLQGLYHHHHPAAQQASFFPSGGAPTFQRFGGPHHGAHQEVDFMHSPASAAAEQAASSEGGPGQQAGAFFSESQTHKTYPHSSFHNSPGGGGSTGVNLPWTMPPSSQHVIMQQQQQQQQQQHSFYNYRSSNPSAAAAATGVYNYALDHTRHLQPAQPSFYLVPARIQGVGLEDELQHQQQQHQQQKRPRQEE